MKDEKKTLIVKLKPLVKQLKKNESSLWTNNSSPTLLMKNLSKNIDSVICQIWSSFKFSKNTCLLAVGGFGRGELAPHSDIDLLILTAEEIQTLKNSIRNSGETRGTLIESLIEVFGDVSLLIELRDE